MTDPTEAYERPLYRERVDLRYWLRVAVYSTIGILLILGVIIAIALTLMILRYISSKPG